MKVDIKFTAVFEEAEEGGYIAYLEELPGINTQGETLEEAKANLKEAFSLVIETQRSLKNEETGDRNVIKEVFELA
ncbi:type II toxin-antitoxin system HicB family antitoxin [Parafilimonas sp.]|uniref:type II toxin-antitoxin system HicB family antitoxin n=1 Tax=Parafilimonas sp. TaxID=1969739 RepID=UPI003F7DE586